MPPGLVEEARRRRVRRVRIEQVDPQEVRLRDVALESHARAAATTSGEGRSSMCAVGPPGTSEGSS
jgi:predicted ATPase with chaperone activity